MKFFADARGVGGLLDRVALRAVLAARALAREDGVALAAAAPEHVHAPRDGPRLRDVDAAAEELRTAVHRVADGVQEHGLAGRVLHDADDVLARPRDVPLAELDVALARGVARRPRDAAELLAHGLHRDRVGAIVATFNRHEVPEAVLLCAVDHLLLGLLGLCYYWVS